MRVFRDVLPSQCDGESEAMNIQHFVQGDHPRWNTDIDDRLNRFPVVLVSNNWLKGSDLHVQPGLEIHTMLEGSGAMLVGKQVMLQSPRSVLLFRGTLPHQMIAKSPYKRTVLCLQLGKSVSEAYEHIPGLRYLLDFEWIPEQACISLSLSPKQFVAIQAMYKQLQQELELRQVGWERMALTQALQITVSLQRCVDQAKLAADEPLSGAMKDLVQQCSDYVCSHLGEELTLKAIAKRFAASEAHLTRSFTKEMGISFYQYVLLQR
ncbi:MAG: hypothetical protein K0Q59_4082, partial [Paenibacillus sp.]|nr:hypothetical protein [Paenibacillus sp.]